MTKILFFGYSQLGCDAFQYLSENFDVVGAVTHKTGDKGTCWFNLVEDSANKHNIPVFMPEADHLKAFTKIVHELKPDLIISVYYRYMIPMSIINIPTLGSYNMHGSFLPHFRGCAPINWAIVKGAKTTGLTLHEMVEKPDAGAMIEQRSCTINPDEIAGELVEKLRPLSLEILKTSLPKIISGTQKRTFLDLAKGSYFGRRKPEDGRINPLTQTAEDVHNLVRALQPSPQYPAAFLEINGETIFVYKTNINLEPPKSIAAAPVIGKLYTVGHQEKWLYCKNKAWVKICNVKPKTVK